MKRKISSGSFATDSDWTPIDADDQDLLRAVAQTGGQPVRGSTSEPDGSFPKIGPRELLFDPTPLGGKMSFSPVDDNLPTSFERVTDPSLRRSPEDDRNLGYARPDEPPTNVDWAAIPMARKSRADPDAAFKWKAPGIVENLKRDFNLTDEQAAGAVGNLGHESNGFRTLQEEEKNKTVPGSRGGWGWAQWTASRRRAFEKYAAENNLDLSSDAANYGYLKHELETTHKNAIAQLRKQQTMADSVVSFEKHFEGAGVKHMDSRNTYAGRALNEHKEQQALARAMQNSDWAKRSLRQPTIPGVQIQPRASSYGFEVVPSRAK